MPCSKGMRRCKALCGHRCMVEGYRAARRADVRSAESLEAGNYQRRDDEEPFRPITFKRWLQAQKVPEEWRDSA